MKRKKVLIVVLALLTVLLFNAVALADDLTDMQRELGQSQNKIDDLKGQQKDLKEEIEEDTIKVKDLEASISNVSQEIKTMEDRIKDVQGRIDVTTKELNTAVQEYNNQDERMKNRINVLYKNGTSLGYIQVVLEASSFADFVSRADIMKKLVDYDINMLKEMKQKREIINKKKVELEADKVELVALKNSLDGKKNQLVKQKSDQSSIIALLGRKLSVVNSSLAQEEEAAKKLKSEIASLLSSKGIYDGSKYAVLRRSDFPDGYKPRITSPYGYRIDPITGSKGAYHSGVDIGTGGLPNMPVYAMAPGRVILAEYYGGYGNTVVIDHGSGLSTLYAHNNKLLVKKGQVVSGADRIALSGSTGRSTGPHVHFGAMKGGDYIDPMPYLLISN